MSWSQFFKVLSEVAQKYYLLAGIAFLIFYLIRKNKIRHRKIQKKFPGTRDYIREIGFSTLSLFIFASVPIIILNSDITRPYTHYYQSINEFGIVYYIAAFPLMMVLHDTYFYWMHRLMHMPALFRTFHLLHHRSTNPSPWAAYAFHPLEAIIEAFITAVLLFVMPIHPSHLIIFFAFSLAYNVYGHLGFELYPKNFNKHWLGKWVNTSVSHNQHHQFFKGNYGLYFTFWDRWMGTLRPDYDQHFEMAKTQKEQVKNVP